MCRGRLLLLILSSGRKGKGGVELNGNNAVQWMKVAAPLFKFRFPGRDDRLGCHHHHTRPARRSRYRSGGGRVRHGRRRVVPFAHFFFSSSSSSFVGVVHESVWGWHATATAWGKGLKKKMQKNNDLCGFAQPHRMGKDRPHTRYLARWTFAQQLP